VIPIGERGFSAVFRKGELDGVGGTVNYYAKTFWKNTNGTNALLGATVSESADPSGTITHGLATAVNDSGTTTNRQTAPAGVTFAGTAANVPGTDLAAGAAIGLWLNMTLATNNAPIRSTYTSQLQINDTAGMGVQAHLPGTSGCRRRSRSAAGSASSRAGSSRRRRRRPTRSRPRRRAGSTSTAILLGSAALTTGSGVSNQMWELEGDVVMEAIGAAGTNSTVRGTGLIACGGLASPFTYPVWGGAASPGTVATVDTEHRQLHQLQRRLLGVVGVEHDHAPAAPRLRAELMQERDLPTAVFRCSASGDQASVVLTYLRRAVGKSDVVRPRPDCPRPGCARYRRAMDEVVQIDYARSV
jgi:hypothetical protein